MRRRLVIVAAMVVAAAVACALTVRWLDDDPAVAGGPAVETGACPEVSMAEEDLYQLPEPPPDAPAAIPDGALRVWMCPGNGGGLDVPRDALTSQVDALAAVVNGLPDLDPDAGCAADGGSIYVLRFQYDGGSVADAAGELFGCGTVQVGSTRHSDGRDWTAAKAFVRLLREQRDGMPPPSAADEPTCGVDETTQFTPVSPVARPDEMTTAVICEGLGEGVGVPPDRVVAVPGADLAVLLADHAENRSGKRPSARECRAGRNLSIVGRTAWGDQVLMAGYCSVFVDASTRPTEEDSFDFWRPGPDARAVIDRLLGTDPVSVAACPAGPDVPLDAEAPEADPGDVPLGAASVRLCLGPGTGFHEPADALLTDVDALAEVVNALEPLDRGRGCTLELGLGYRLVFGYPDGTGMDVTGRMYGCDEVTVGDAELAGADRPFDAFVDALRTQRTTAEPPRRTAQPTCRGPRGVQRELISPVALPAEMTQASLCVLTPDTSTVTHRSRITRSELTILLTDRATSSDEVAPSDTACARDPRAFTLHGVTAWGDRVVMSGYCGAVLDPGRFPDGTTTYWHPGPEARAILDRLYDDAERLRR